MISTSAVSSVGLVMLCGSVNKFGSISRRQHITLLYLSVCELKPNFQSSQYFRLKLSIILSDQNPQIRISLCGFLKQISF